MIIKKTKTNINVNHRHLRQGRGLYQSLRIKNNRKNRCLPDLNLGFVLILGRESPISLCDTSSYISWFRKEVYMFIIHPLTRIFCLKTRIRSIGSHFYLILLNDIHRIWISSIKCWMYNVIWYSQEERNIKQISLGYWMGWYYSYKL